VDALRIIVCGYIVRGPIGGLVWHHLQYLLGLRRLGHEVLFIEDSDDHASCYDPRTGETTTDASYGLKFARRTFEEIGFGGGWAYHDAHTRSWHGPIADRAVELCARADLLLNLSEMNPLRPWLAGIPRRVLIDTDPAFTQARHLMDSRRADLAAGHTDFFTYATNVDGEDCDLPDDGFPWRPTRQPLMLEATRAKPGRPGARYTTVMIWDSYPRLTLNGRSFGRKAESFPPYFDLPSRTDAELELAIGGSAPRDLLHRKGWHICDPRPMTNDLNAYERFIERSKAEFSLAKHAYVVTRSGWFSERSVAYLASGRPVVLQDTAFSAWLKAEQGVRAFSTPNEAIDGIREIDHDYGIHCKAARQVAAENFDSDRVLMNLLEVCFSGSKAR
jgi:hypothetical protein